MCNKERSVSCNERQLLSLTVHESQQARRESERETESETARPVCPLLCRESVCARVCQTKQQPAFPVWFVCAELNES